MGRADGQPIPGSRMRELLLRSWDRRLHLYRLQVNRGRLRRLRQRTPSWSKTEKVVGFSKSCLLGPPLLVYEDGGTWFLQVKDRRWALTDDDLEIQVKKSLVGRRIEITTPRCRHTCRLVDLGDRLAKRLDPTYDDLDSVAADFPRWLAERRAEVRQGK